MAAALLLTCAVAGAAGAAEQNQVRAGVNRGQYKPLAAIVAELNKQHPGRVLDVETKHGPQGDLRYEITIADPQGHKHELLVDAATGQVVAQEPSPSAQALPMAKLADYLRRAQQQLGGRVIDAEFEISRGKAHYKLKLAQGGSMQKVLMDAATGNLLTPHGNAPHAIAPMHEVLRMLHAQFGEMGVLEMELEQDEHQGIYYEIELAHPSGGTLELDVDAKTGAILRRRLED